MANHSKFRAPLTAEQQAAETARLERLYPVPTRLWVARVAKGDYNPVGGRTFLGYVGWHATDGQAMAEAQKRHREHVGNIAVSVA